MAGGLGDAELLEFLFLPGFSTAREVTEYSGRGVGLDVVQTTIRQIGGTVRVSTRPGRGTTFHLQLPVTLSVGMSRRLVATRMAEVTEPTPMAPHQPAAVSEVIVAMVPRVATRPKKTKTKTSPRPR